MTTARTTRPNFGSATLDHRTGATMVGGPASRYHRVARCDDRRVERPNYTSRRWGAALVAACTLLLGGWGVGEVAAGGTAGEQEQGRGQTDLASASLVARSGDSLWSIAQTHRGDTSIEAFIDELVALNGGTSIMAGQTVLLP